MALCLSDTDPAPSRCWHPAPGYRGFVPAGNRQCRSGICRQRRDPEASPWKCQRRSTFGITAYEKPPVQLYRCADHHFRRADSGRYGKRTGYQIYGQRLYGADRPSLAFHPEASFRRKDRDGPGRTEESL